MRMKTKKHLNLNIESAAVEEARKRFLNLSEIAERAIKDALGKVTVEIDTEAKKCHICGIIGKKETAESVERKQSAMTWLYPDEIWICNKCLRYNKINQIPAASKIHY